MPITNLPIFQVLKDLQAQKIQAIEENLQAFESFQKCNAIFQTYLMERLSFLKETGACISNWLSETDPKIVNNLIKNKMRKNDSLSKVTYSFKPDLKVSLTDAEIDALAKSLNDLGCNSKKSHPIMTSNKKKKMQKIKKIQIK